MSNVVVLIIDMQGHGFDWGIHRTSSILGANIVVLFYSCKFHEFDVAQCNLELKF